MARADHLVSLVRASVAGDRETLRAAAEAIAATPRELGIRDWLARHPERVLEIAVKGMLPKGPLGRAMYRKLKVYSGSEHPHAAQQPQPLDI